MTTKTNNVRGEDEMKLRERLYEMRRASEPLGGGVFVDIRPSEFQDLIGAAVEALDQQPAAAGEEIMVNAAHDVYTLPLQPSGLSSVPRFVVHVPGPDRPAEGVQAGEVDQRARELLATEYERAGMFGAATDTRNRAWGDHLDHEICIRAIASALSQQPEAQGVVDEGSRSVTRQLLHWGGIPVHVTGTVTTSPGNWSLIDAALTGERNG